MKLFKYEDFINESIVAQGDNVLIYKYCLRYGIKNYTINEDGTVDVDGDVVLSPVNYPYERLTKLPLKFGKVTGNFSCSNNILTTLEGCPKKVGGSFNCSNNDLTSLEFAPKEVDGDFFCDHNQLMSLEGSPEEVGGIFTCGENKMLSSLKGAPIKVGGYFDCRFCSLVNLIGCPIEVGTDIYCAGNKLDSLKGCAREVSGFYCAKNKLTDVKGFPKIIGGGFSINDNPVDEVLSLFSIKNYIESIEYLNEYNVIRDGNKVVMQALEVVYDELGLEVPENIEIEGYEII